MISLVLDSQDVLENPVRWLGTYHFEDTADAALDSKTWYKVLELSVGDNCFEIIDNEGRQLRVNAEDFEIVPWEEQYEKQMEEHSKKLEEYYKKLEEHNKSLKLSSKNFSATVIGNLFKVEAVDLSEEKINKIMDILCK